MRHIFRPKVFKVELQLFEKKNKTLFESFISRASSVKEAKKLAQKDFLKKTILIDPKQLPRDSNFSF